MQASQQFPQQSGTPLTSITPATPAKSKPPRTTTTTVPGPPLPPNVCPILRRRPDLLDTSVKQTTQMLRTLAARVVPERARFATHARAKTTPIQCSKCHTWLVDMLSSLAMYTVTITSSSTLSSSPMSNQHQQPSPHPRRHYHICGACRWKDVAAPPTTSTEFDVEEVENVVVVRELPQAQRQLALRAPMWMCLACHNAATEVVASSSSAAPASTPKLATTTTTKTKKKTTPTRKRGRPTKKESSAATTAAAAKKSRPPLPPPPPRWTSALALSEHWSTTCAHGTVSIDNGRATLIPADAVRPILTPLLYALLDASNPARRRAREHSLREICNPSQLAVPPHSAEPFASVLATSSSPSSSSSSSIQSPTMLAQQPPGRCWAIEIPTLIDGVDAYFGTHTDMAIVLKGMQCAVGEVWSQAGMACATCHVFTLNKVLACTQCFAGNHVCAMCEPNIPADAVCDVCRVPAPPPVHPSSSSSSPLPSEVVVRGPPSVRASLSSLSSLSGMSSIVSDTTHGNSSVTAAAAAKQPPPLSSSSSREQVPVACQLLPWEDHQSPEMRDMPAFLLGVAALDRTATAVINKHTNGGGGGGGGGIGSDDDDDDDDDDDGIIHGSKSESLDPFLNVKSIPTILEECHAMCAARIHASAETGRSRRSGVRGIFLRVHPPSTPSSSSSFSSSSSPSVAADVKCLAMDQWVDVLAETRAAAMRASSQLDSLVSLHVSNKKPRVSIRTSSSSSTSTTKFP